jgi:hypothetical protein
MTLFGANDGRALVLAPGGVFVIDVTGAASEPAFLPSLGVPRQPIVRDGTLTFAAGLRGVFHRGLDEPSGLAR